ncbi:MAG: TonB-dependent receptor [Gammaproteobacteria bacterium]|nr:TonB-dependent receptor [Gammaproteobacteria bacterium]MDH5305167.1 TonB-dependent receptor [Gammaproteobacteria bacterium]MDH5323435.1 TonB-dependent receptor [Gammaproteobacteria bacterium]
MTRYFQLALLALATVACGASFAQEQATDAAAASPDQSARGVTVYPASFFTDLGAVSALDMVRQIPGFTFQDADNSRGYAGAGGNVLINGRRPSTKTTRLQQLLQRIPAASVAQVEVILGGTPGYDMQGLPVVANLIRTRGDTTARAVEGIIKFHPGGDLSGIGRAEGRRSSDTVSMEGFVEIRDEIDDEEAGKGPISRVDAAGNLLQQGTFVAEPRTVRLQALGTLEKGTQDGLFRANFSLGSDRGDSTETTVLNDTFGVTTSEVVESDTGEDELEIGVDYDGSLGNGTSMQLVGVQTLAQESDDSTRISGDELQAASTDEQSGETILRGLLRKQLAATLNLEAGAEAAFNFLDSATKLAIDGQSIDLPAANVLVEELRGEIFTTLTMQPTEQSTLEMGLRGETSEITVTGDADAKNNFSFMKPRIVGTYSTQDGVQIRLRVEREIGQLDFADYAAGSELADNTVDAGNPDLRPEQAWVYEAAYEQPFGSDGALTVTYRHFDLTDVIDLVPVEGFAAPGNIGDGKRHEIGLSMSIPLMQVGPGLGRLQLSGTWRDSEVIDPVTGDSRGISGEPSFAGEVLYSRDFPSLNGTLGMRGELTSKETSYRLEQIIASRNENYWRIYWDWRASATISVRAMIENPTSRDRARHRVRYDGSRADDIVEYRERRSAIYDPVFVVRVRRTF